MDKEDREGPKGELAWDVVPGASFHMAGMCSSEVNVPPMKNKGYILQLKCSTGGSAA